MTRHERPSSRHPPRRGVPRDDGSPRDAKAPDATGVVPTGKPGQQRIARAMARAGLCSRRDAETWVLAGRVTVNGEVLSSPARDVGPDDGILVDGVPLPAAEKTRLFLFHKPRGLVTSDHDPEGRETVADFLRENWPEGPRTVTVGRLDINTEGLLLLTNDGGLARILELPETGWLRRYRVRAKGMTDQATLDTLASGIEVDGIDYVGIEAKLDRLQGSNCWLTMGLREGKNREIKRVLEHIGLEVNRLIRLSFGPFQLLDLPEGAVEEVRTRVLRDQLGDSLAAAAGVDFGEAAAAPEVAAPTFSDDGSHTRARPLPKGFAPSRTRGITPTPQVAGERQDRPQGPRRHVSALRASETAAPDGPRRRIERSKTKDRHDRAVTVERVTIFEPTRPTGAKHASPSAEAKRVRIARSGGDAAHGRHKDRQVDRAERGEDARGSRSQTRRGPGGDRRHGEESDRTGRWANGPRRSGHADSNPAGVERRTGERPRFQHRDSDRFKPRGDRPPSRDREDATSATSARKSMPSAARFAKTGSGKGKAASRFANDARGNRGPNSRTGQPKGDRPNRPGRPSHGGAGKPPSRGPGGRSRPNR